MLFSEGLDAVFGGSGRCFWRVWALFLEGSIHCGEGFSF